MKTETKGSNDGDKEFDGEDEVTVLKNVSDELAR